MGNTRKSQSMSILTVVGHEVFRSTNSLSALSESAVALSK